jgi:23S rRNA (uracil1939-C5)-methyltransferase
MTEFTVDIISLVYEGHGLGRLPDGKAVFVPFVLPGEKARIKIREEKKRFAYGELIEILEASDDRITPSCKHFGNCGGCHYQYIPYELQLEYKRSIFCEQLQRMSGIEEPIVEKIIPSDQEWNYRNSLQFHLSPEGKLAFIDPKHSNAFKVEECLLPMGEIANIWPLLNFEKENQIRRIEIRQNEKDETLVKLEGALAAIPEIEITSSISMVHSNANEQVVISGDDHLIVSLSGKNFKVSAGSFFQTNLSGAKALVDCVLEMTEGFQGTLMDLYCGVGLFSTFLAEKFERIISIESSASACQDFVENLDQYDHIALYEGKVEKVLPGLEIKPDCVVIDPPRKGIDRFALDALVEKRPPAIIYVSCNPATLARDVKRLMRSGYTLERSIIVDMFPQTFHIESVNYLTIK